MIFSRKFRTELIAERISYNLCISSSQNKHLVVKTHALLRNLKSAGFIFCLFLFLFTYSCSYGQIRYKETQTEVIVYGKRSQLVFSKKQWHVGLKDGSGRLVFEEGEAPSFKVDDAWLSISSIFKVKKLNGQTIGFQLKMADNKAAMARVEVINDNGFRIKIELSGEKASAIKLANKLKPQEEVYGFGEMWNGSVSQRGKAIELWDKNGTPDECAYIPYYVTTSNYAYFLDYGGRVNVDVGKTESDRITMEAPASSISILLTSGNNIAETVSNYLKITGLPNLPPRWSFKPWFWLATPFDQPKGGKFTAQDVLIAAQKFKQLDIPAGVTWLEPPWQAARNSFEPSDKFTKDFKGFVNELHGMGLKVLCWTTPYTLPSSPNWAEAAKNNYLVKNTVNELPKPRTADGKIDQDFSGNYIDFTNPSAKKWWQSQISKVLKLGIDGFKLDAGQDLPEDAVLYGGKPGKDLHNSYALYYNKTFYEILNRTRKGDFLTIPRSAFAGANKYLVFKWPGDLMASFASNGLPSTVYSSISAGLSGFPFISTDIGGFSGRPTTEEVWIRWAQFGAMIPGMQTLSMPWWFSKKASDYYRYLSWLHTDLVPFWMSLAHEAHQNGAPLVRHLVWSFQDDPKVWRRDDEYTLGKSILVAPIMTAENTRKVYLPKGNWFDFWTDEKLTGQKEINWSGDLYHFPVYIAEGAIIPMEVKNDVTGFGTKNSGDYITVAIWPKLSGNSKFRLQDTEGPVNFNVSRAAGSTLQIKWSSSMKKYIFRIHLDSAIPRKITDNGNNVTAFSSLDNFNKTPRDGWYYDEETKKLWIKKKADGVSNTILIYQQSVRKH
jgi:alpha-D-xyloside xylohydrolase